MAFGFPKNFLVVEIHGCAFLFNKSFGRNDKPVDETVRDRDFKVDKFFRLGDIEHVAQ